MTADVHDLVGWLESPECSYGGIHDRLLLGHHTMRLVDRLSLRRDPASEAAAEAEVAAEAEAEEAKARLHAEIERERSEGEAARRDLEDARRAHAEAMREERERLSDERAKMARHHADFLTRMADVATATAAIERREAETHARLERRDAEREARLEARLSNLQSDEVRRLQREIDRLKGTNHVKGVEGEVAVASAMRAAFDSWTFVDTSSRGAESDFHLVSPTGETLVVEVKNKVTLTATGDVAKSLRDVGELRARLGEAFLGYLFVSLRSRAIPGKGALSLELSSGTPVLWCGLEGGSGGGEELLEEGAARDVVRAGRILVDAGRFVARLRAATLAAEQFSAAIEDADRERDLAEAIERLDAQLRRVEQMRAIANRLSESATTTRRHAVAMQGAVDAAFLEISSGSGSGSRPRSQGGDAPAASAPAATAPAPSGSFPCLFPGCAKVCASKQGLANHSKSHSIQIPDRREQPH